MTPRRSFDILELPEDATLDDAHRAYKDMATVWHPDRFAVNPRLKQRAERKLKELNIAYETARTFLQQAEMSDYVSQKTGSSSGSANRRQHSYPKGESRSRSPIEIASEAGTVLVLNVCSYFWKNLKHFMK